MASLDIPGRGVEVDECVPFVGGERAPPRPAPAAPRSSGCSPSTSSSPAGSSSSQASIGWRYWVTRRTCRLIVKGHHTDRARVGDDLALGDRAVAHPHPVAPHRDHPPGEDLLAVQRLVLVPHEDAASGSCWAPRPSSSTTSADAGADAARLVLGDLHRQPLGRVVLEGRGDERAEQRVRPRRAGLQFRMRLGAGEERVDLARQLDELDQPPVRRGTGDHQPGPSRAARGRRC